MKSGSWFVFAFAFATACSFAQNQIPSLNDNSTTMTTPAQLRRIEPPSGNASAAELEENGDILRAEKFYADAIDYYDAAIHKSASPAQLYNKEGIAQLQMQASTATWAPRTSRNMTTKRPARNMRPRYHSIRKYSNGTRRPVSLRTCLHQRTVRDTPT